jgi:hypothetical protein
MKPVSILLIFILWVNPTLVVVSYSSEVPDPSLLAYVVEEVKETAEENAENAADETESSAETEPAVVEAEPASVDEPASSSVEAAPVSVEVEPTSPKGRVTLVFEASPTDAVITFEDDKLGISPDPVVYELYAGKTYTAEFYWSPRQVMTEDGNAMLAIDACTVKMNVTLTPEDLGQTITVHADHENPNVWSKVDNSGLIALYIISSILSLVLTLLLL